VVLKAREEEAVVSADQSCRRGTEAEATDEEEEAKRDMTIAGRAEARRCCCCC
jgi:hypothetical protein